MIDLPSNRLSWRCVDDNDADTWLRFYATEQERLQWLADNEGPLPEAQPLPYPRKLPGAE